ncbi:MAG: RAMP superfamily CRISPR-associated protein [Thiomicrospira sp.]|jgi:CRISPR/Cas system CSM-associated protein Csm3 (group 7 of RAMP superfamily)
MLLHNTPIFYSAFVTVECETPLSVKADDADLTLDTRLVRDVNGYPILPGTSIAGVLRHVARQCQADEKMLFGSAGDQDKPSQIQVSFGFIHNAKNQPITGLLSTVHRQTDNNVELLLQDLMPIMRDQVAIDEYGAAKKGAKMDRTAVPKGTRFSFELNWASETPDDDQWNKILAWLYHPEFRLGGLTHRGFGKVKMVSIKQQRYDFKQPSDLEKWQKNRQHPFNAQHGQDVTTQITNPNAGNFIRFALDLEAEDFWRIGQGDKALGKLGQDYDKEPDLKPYTETVIQWQNDQACLTKQQIVIPASGIKGALRHRTLFHYRRLHNDFSDGTKPCERTDQELKDLFGTTEGKGLAGSLIIDDIYLDKTPPHKVMMHNKIDRFTGGTIDGALFSEQLLYGGGFRLTGQIKQGNQSPQLLEAFRLALLDLAEGRLALGGGSTKGHGYFQAKSHDLTALEQAANLIQEKTA